ncbi:anti-sigma factor [Paenibacillus methanolicus]|uniref:Anti-sigma-K factor rskA n=1 Tax=Paenibacillus methanolicus TaxID=582686 RepID=A0A5S5C687_9BACL|nr:anti-sigma factor [Paenibacillus methanolicus]TYP74854.1 anti-sigma-K factor rskA [Paenibacillus methanolicus]
MSANDRNRQTCTGLYAEEDIVDLLMNRKTAAEAHIMRRHLAACAACRAKADEWTKLLDEEAPGAAGGMAGEGERITAPMPSDAVRLRLARRVRRAAARKRIADAAHGHRKALSVGAAAAVLFVSLASLLRMAHEPEERRAEYVAEHEPRAMVLVNNPQTSSLVHAAGDELGDGYVWFNGVSREVFVLLEGLLPSDDLDVRAWAENDGGRENLGVLRHEEANLAHLYVRGRSLDQARHIVLTVEPSGGSVKPSAPDALVFRLPAK